VRERLLAGAGPGAHRAQLLPDGDPEMKCGADALAAEREAVPRAVATEEDAVLGGGAQPVREPVALPALDLGAEPPRELLGRLAHVMARLVGAHADALLPARGHAPGKAPRRQRAVDPDVQRAVGGAGVRMHLEPTAQWCVGRLVAALRQHAPPPERVDDQRRMDVAAVGVDREACAPVHLRRLEARVALGEEVLAERAVVERRPAPRQAVAHGPVRRGERHVGQHRALRALHAHRLQPALRNGAGRRLALADRVAVDQEHVGARAGELAGDGQSGEARAADQHVGARAVEGGALGAAGSRALRHAASTS
jgi:hypothetical protein